MLTEYLSKSLLDADDITRAARIAVNGYLNEPSTGAWAVVSKRFVEATPPGSAINSYTSTAKPDRTWALTEVPAILDKLPDTQVVGKTTVGELKLIRDQGGMDAVFEKMMSDAAELTDETRLYFDSDGSIVGASNSQSTYSGDSIIDIGLDEFDETTIHFDSEGKIVGTSNSQSIYSGESKFTTSPKDYFKYSSDTDMTTKYADYKNYSALEKLQAKQFDYEKRLVSDMVDRGITSEKGIDLLPTDELKTKYSFVDDATDANIIKQLQLAEYRNSKYGSGVADSITLYFDETGSVVAASNQSYKTNIESNIKYTTTIEDYLSTSKNFLLDETMESMYKGYKDLTPLEKIQAKQLDYDFRQVKLKLDKIAISDATMNKYLVASKKEARKLNAVDRQLMKIADGISGGKDDIAKSLTNFANKCKVLGKVSNILMTSVDVVGTVAIAALSISQAIELYNAGYEGEASAIIAGCAVDVLGGMAGGTVLSGALSPYFIGFGAAIGGPVGATFGAIVSGVISYGLAGLAASELGEFVRESWDDIVATVGDAYNVVTEEIDDLYGGVLAFFDPDADGAYYGGSDENDSIYGGDGDNKIEGFAGNDKMHGLAGRDMMYGGNGNDVIYGESGNDVLYGDSGNDTLIGGIGEDVLYGGSGNDTYIWETGSGIDQIFDSSGLNKIVFKGTYPEDLRVMYFNTGEAIIYNKKTKEMVALPEFTLGSAYHNFELEFANGQIMSVDSPLSPFVCNVEGTNADNTLYAYFKNSTLTGMDGNDNLIGSSGSDTMLGGEGDDYFEGGAGNDILYGNEGSDYLKGGDGNDTYVNSAGDGTDVIEDTSGINTIKFTDSAVEDVIVSVHGTSDAVMYSLSNGNTLLLPDFRSIKGDELKLQFKNSEEMNADADDSPFLRIYGSDENDTIDTFFDNGEAYGFGGNDTMNGGNGVDALYGYDGEDKLSGGGGNDVLYGGNDSDNLNGSAGDDYLIGGNGDDKLEGGAGYDSYFFELGWGNDTLFDYDTSVSRGGDTLVFGEGIAPEDIRLVRAGNELTITNLKTGDKITVNGAYYYKNGYGMIDNIQFSDGTLLNIQGVTEKVRQGGINGTDGADSLSGLGDMYGYTKNEILRGYGGNDTINAGVGDDVIYGGTGNDTVYGEDGNDVLTGGSGNDSINGSYGDDTYYFNLGDGEDVISENSKVCDADRIVFGEGITEKDVKAERIGNDLVIKYSATDKITVKSAYSYKTSYGYGRYFVENIQFADGTVWDTNKIAKEANIHIGTDNADTMTNYVTTIGYDENEVYYAGAGNDVVNAGDGNDTLYGEKGNDCLNGGSGNDTYIFYAGCGKDTIYDYSGTNKIQFTDDIRPEDITISRVGTYNIVLTIAGCEDTITIQDFMYSSSYRNFTLTFADGRTATFDVTNLCLIYEPAKEEPVADLDTLTQENAQSLADLMAEGDVTSNTQTTTSQNDLSAIMLEGESVDVSTDTQAGLLAQELSASTTDNNVFTADNTTTVEQTQLFTEQCTVA